MPSDPLANSENVGLGLAAWLAGLEDLTLLQERLLPEISKWDSEPRVLWRREGRERCPPGKGRAHGDAAAGRKFSTYLNSWFCTGLMVQTDPEGFEPSTAGLEIRSPIRARRRVRTLGRRGNLNNPSTPQSENRYVARPILPDPEF